MSGPGHVLIVGGGLAGAKTAEALRDQGHEGPITILAAEHHLPYERPPLSKSYLMGESLFSDAVVHTAAWYRDHDVEVRVGVRATALDAAAHTVTADDGSTLGYDKLVLATGSLVRTLPLPGADAAGVLHLRTVEDADAIRAHLGEGRRIVLVGGGWIGLEVAAAARDTGSEVTVLEAGELPLLGVLGPELAQVFADLHISHGVDLRLSAKVDQVVTDGGRAVGVRLHDGEVIEADAVVIGVGVQPDVALAAEAGLAVDNGVLVDATLRTSDPAIYAVGDIANNDPPVLGRRVRVEHWATALNQPAVAAAALLGGEEPYRELPYFYSDQYDLGMEYIGNVPRGTETTLVIRGDAPGREFVAFWLDDEDHLLAVMNVNVWEVVDKVKHLIVEGRPVDKVKLADPGIDYADL